MSKSRIIVDIRGGSASVFADIETKTNADIIIVDHDNASISATAVDDLREINLRDFTTYDGYAKVCGPKPIPPDPENMNDDRAEWARKAMETFRSVTGADAEDSMSDLLCNLMHMADRDGIDFEDVMCRATRSYVDETLPLKVGHA